MPSGLFYLKSLEWSISYIECLVSILLLLCFKEIPIFNANSVDPDQTPRSAASDQGLRTLFANVLFMGR